MLPVLNYYYKLTKLHIFSSSLRNCVKMFKTEKHMSVLQKKSKFKIIFNY